MLCYLLYQNDNFLKFKVNFFLCNSEKISTKTLVQKYLYYQKECYVFTLIYQRYFIENLLRVFLFKYREFIQVRIYYESSTLSGQPSNMCVNLFVSTAGSHRAKNPSEQSK